MAKTRSRSREFKRNTRGVIDMEEARRERREKRAVLIEETERKKAERAADKENAARRRSIRIKRRFVYIVVILVIFSVIAACAANIVTLLKEKDELVQENAKLTETKERLKEELEEVSSPEYIEQQARSHLRLIKPGEILYVLPRAGNNSETQGNEQE